MKEVEKSDHFSFLIEINKIKQVSFSANVSSSFLGSLTKTKWLHNFLIY